MTRLANRTELGTSVKYNETKRLPNRDSKDGIIPLSPAIRVRMLSGLQYREVVLRSVASACRFVTRRPDNPGWSEFRSDVVTAVSEAFNNIVLHGYNGRSDGIIELEIRTRPNHISVKLRDFGTSFDLNAIPPPRLDELPESGLGVYIMRELMEVKYRPGHPNVLTLSKDFYPANGVAMVEGDA